MFPNETPDSPEPPSTDIVKIDDAKQRMKASLAEEFRESLLRVKDALASIKKPRKK